MRSRTRRTFEAALPLLGRHRHPDLVAALEVREAVVGDVVAHVPERERRERRQEGDAADDLVEPVVLGVAAMAGVVSDDEQPCDGHRCRHHHQGLGPPGVEVARADDAGAEKGEIEQQAQHRERANRGAGIPAWRRARSCGHRSGRIVLSGRLGASVISRQDYTIQALSPMSSVSFSTCVAHREFVRRSLDFEDCVRHVFAAAWRRRYESHLHHRSQAGFLGAKCVPRSS